MAASSRRCSVETCCLPAWIRSTLITRSTAIRPVVLLHRPNTKLYQALAFHRRIGILTAELGLLARDLRVEEKRNPHDRCQAVARRRQERIGALQDTLRRTWNEQMPISVANGYCNQILPVGARGIFEHVSGTLSTSGTFIRY